MIYHCFFLIIFSFYHIVMLKYLAVLDQKHPSAKTLVLRELFHDIIFAWMNNVMNVCFREISSSVFFLPWVQISLWMKCWWYCVQNFFNASIVSYHIKTNVKESRIACNAENATKILMRVWMYSILCDSYSLITLVVWYEIVLMAHLHYFSNNL